MHTATRAGQARRVVPALLLPMAPCGAIVLYGPLAAAVAASKPLNSRHQQSPPHAPSRSMFPFFAFPGRSSVVASALNSLARREPWAAERLSPHAGKVVTLVVGSLSVSLFIAAEGRLQPAAADAPADVTLTLPVDRLAGVPRALSGGNPAAVAELMHVQGDAGLANAVSYLAQHLRFDIEHELASRLGDIPAMRLLAAGRAVASGARESGRRFAANAAEYLSEESGLMASRPALQSFAEHIAQLNRRLDALDARLASAPGAPAAGKA